MEKGVIFVRERNKVGTEEKKPRFCIVATAGIDINFKARHARKKELEMIAEKTGAELVYLEIEKKHE